jgi:superfamily I DNA/RNA helicase
MNDTSKNEFVWSAQQLAIFEWFKSGKGNLVVRARAGSSKTTSIIEGIRYAPESSILLAAFNKAIAEELVKKLKNPAATAKTLHSVGFSAILANWKGTKVDSARGQRLARAALGKDTPDPIVNLTARIAATIKNVLGPTASLSEAMKAAENFDLVPEEYQVERGFNLQRLCTAALQACRLACQNDGTVDFDDMVYVAVANRFVRPVYGLVVIDECQDMNVTQIALARMACKAGGRIAVVGDDRQAIYGFRGADSGSLDRLKAELSAVEMGLTITYRCPKAVVALAAELVPDYEAAPTAPEGTVKDMDYGKLFDAAQAGDFVLSRKNAPLARTCLGLLRAGKPARVEGKDIGANLLRLVRKLAR